MKKYLFTEIFHIHGWNDGEIIKAKNLTSAKRLALTKSMYIGSILKLETGKFISKMKKGTIVDATAKLSERSIVSLKKYGKKWDNNSEYVINII